MNELSSSSKKSMLTRIITACCIVAVCLPAVLLGLMALFPKYNIGVELASIILIFTSQAWNMTFSFYNSIKLIPKDLDEASDVFRLNKWQKFRKLEVPFSMMGLVWNSMMSWAGGWFFR